MLGRTIAGPVGRCLGPSRLWALVLLRFAFVPLFMLGQRSPETSGLWGSDVGRMGLCALFAISNGLAANLAMMFGPECCSVQEKKEVAGMAMSAIMVTGASGSIAMELSLPSHPSRALNMPKNHPNP